MIASRFLEQRREIDSAVVLEVVYAIVVEVDGLLKRQLLEANELSVLNQVKIFSDFDFVECRSGEINFHVCCSLVTNV
jgi:hypothetical protein